MRRCKRSYVYATFSCSSPSRCNDTQLMDLLFFFTAGELSAIPMHGTFRTIYTRFKAMWPLTVSCAVFTILRTFALLQDYSWRRLVIWSLSAIALAVITLGSVRIHSLGRIWRSSYEYEPQYEDFAIDWAYVRGPLSGSSCAQIGFTIPLGIMNQYVHQYPSISCPLLTHDQRCALSLRSKTGANCLLLVVTTAASAVSFVSAAFVLGIILLKTARQVHQASTLGLQISLSEVLLRDGMSLVYHKCILG